MTTHHSNITIRATIFIFRSVFPCTRTGDATECGETPLPNATPPAVAAPVSYYAPILLNLLPQTPDLPTWENIDQTGAIPAVEAFQQRRSNCGLGLQEGLQVGDPSPSEHPGTSSLQCHQSPAGKADCPSLNIEEQKGVILPAHTTKPCISHPPPPQPCPVLFKAPPQTHQPVPIAPQRPQASSHLPRQL